MAAPVWAGEDFRTWTQRSGGRQAEARLVSVQGDEVRLQGRAGQRLRTTVQQLSDLDRAHVQSFMKQATAGTEAGALPAVRSFLTYLPGVPGAFAQMADRKAAPAVDPDMAPSGVFGSLMRPLPDKLPTHLVHLRLSKSFLEEFVEREIERDQRIQDNILGTRIVGNASTRGTTELVLHPSDDRAVAEVVFSGVVRSRSIGHNGPVRLHCTSHTPFEARKLVHFGPNGMEALATKTTARSQSQTHAIEALLPGLRGRIAERVAWRRSAELRSQADAIASRHTADRLSAEFDKSVEHSIQTVQSFLRGKFDELATRETKLPTQMEYRSTADYLEMVLSSDAAGPDIAGPDAGAIASVSSNAQTTSASAREASVPAYDKPAKISLRVHRAYLKNAITDPQVRSALQPVMLGLSLRSRQAEIRATSTADAPSPGVFIAWSKDMEWLEIDFGRELPPKLPAETVAAAELTK